MSYLGSKEFDPEVAKSKVAGHASVRVFGRNTALSTTEEGLWIASTAFNFLQTAVALRIRSGGNANDTAAGTGAQSVLLYGLDGSGDELNAISLTTAGASASSATAETFLRLNYAAVGAVGTYGGSNAGPILIETTGGTLVAQIGTGVGETKLGLRSIPNGKTGYLRRVRFMVEGSKAADLKVYVRENFDDVTTPFSPARSILTLDALDGGQSDGFDFVHGLPIPGKSDIWMTGQVSSGNPEASGALELTIVDD